jgi:hypothetical protein
MRSIVRKARVLGAHAHTISNPASHNSMVGAALCMHANDMMSMTVSKRYAHTTSTDHVHFKASNKPHPLLIQHAKNVLTQMPSGNVGSVTIQGLDAETQAKFDEEMRSGDHTGRLQNHIWSKEEIDNCMATLYHHQPKTITDHVTNKLVRRRVSLCIYVCSF